MPSPKSTTYPVLDSLQNFRIKVRLERIGSVIDGPSAIFADSGQNDVEEFTFRWQQKVFSPREFSLYSNASKYATPLEVQYNREITELSKLNGRQTNKLFTYIDGDQLPPNLASKLASTGLNEVAKDSQFTERVTNVRRRKILPQSRIQSTALLNPICDLPSADQQKISRSVAISTKFMCIMVYLGSKETNEWNKDDFPDEKIICLIQLTNDCQMTLTPDFNVIQRLEGRTDVFHSIISNASTQLVENERKRNAKYPPLQLVDFRSSLMSSKLGTTFDVPEDGVLKILFLIRICCACNFEYDGLYVHYLVDLPKGWYTPNPDTLQGVTQRCFTSTVEQDEIAHFSLPIELTLCYQWDPYDCPLEPGFRWPKLLVCICSLDDLSRHRTEGYGSVSLPTVPGASTVIINTWRPRSDRTAELRRFFVGGNTELESIRSVVVNEDQKNRASRIGLRTTSSGIVTVTFETLHQCRSFIGSEQKRQLDYGALITRIGLGFDVDKAAGLHWSLISILEAFERARRRMLFVRDHFFYTNQSFNNYE